MAIKTGNTLLKNVFIIQTEAFNIIILNTPNLLKKNGIIIIIIIISLTEQYDPYENAIAERINSTLKYEYGLRNCIKNTAITQEIKKQAVPIYNNLRLHFNLDLRKPAEVI